MFFFLQAQFEKKKKKKKKKYIPKYSDGCILSLHQLLSLRSPSLPLLQVVLLAKFQKPEKSQVETEIAKQILTLANSKEIVASGSVITNLAFLFALFGFELRQGDQIRAFAPCFAAQLRGVSTINRQRFFSAVCRFLSLWFSEFQFGTESSPLVSSPSSGSLFFIFINLNYHYERQRRTLFCGWNFNFFRQIVHLFLEHTIFSCETLPSFLLFKN